MVTMSKNLNLPDVALSDPVRHFNQRDLARRWQMSERTLERQRYLRQGPPYIKVGAHVLYRIEDILSYEAAQIRQGPL